MIELSGGCYKFDLSHRIVWTYLAINVALAMRRKNLKSIETWLHS